MNMIKMAEVKGDGGKVQIVFLVDVFTKQRFGGSQEFVEICKLKCQAISLCVLRLLLHFQTSPKYSNQTKPLSWGFKFYNSCFINFEYKRRRFCELNSESFERFEQEIKERFHNVCHSDEKDLRECSNGAKALSCSVTEILHDFSWTMPDISSPFRNEKGDQKVFKKSRNFLFVLGDCPQTEADLEDLLGRKGSCYNEDVLMKEIFSPALYEEFRNTCDMSLFWVDTGLWCLASEKLDTFVKDWKGHYSMLAITKQLAGNMIPIALLVQDVGSTFGNCFSFLNKRHDSGPNSTTTKFSAHSGKDADEIADCTNEAMQALFKFSFGETVQAFLTGEDLTGLSVLRGISSISSDNTLFHGFLYYQDERICHLKLVPMITEKASMSSNGVSHKYCATREDSSMISDIAGPQSLLVNISRNCVFSSEKSCSSTVQDLATSSDCASKTEFWLKAGQKHACKTEQSLENSFCIKGVVPHGDVSPSWLHPTKLYSCMSFECLTSCVDGSKNPETTGAACSGLLQQLLSIISSKNLTMVVEFRDPGSCTFVTGLLQPVTSVCAVLSVVRTEMLLVVEKLLLRHRSHGHSLVWCDLNLKEPNANTLPVELCENIPLSSCEVHKELLFKRTSSQSNLILVKESSCIEKQNHCKSQKKNVIDLYVRNVDCKQSNNKKHTREVLVKLKNYYRDRQAGKVVGKIDESAAYQTMARGKICQDASQRNNALIDKETKFEPNNVASKRESLEDADDRTSSSNLDSEQADTAMEIDEQLPDMTDIQTVDDFKTAVNEGYLSCVDKGQSAVVYANHVLAMIDHLRSSGELKDLHRIMTVLRSSVLFDNKSLKEKFETREDTANNDKLVQEYTLQVYLRLELVSKVEGTEEESLADEITAMLRGISFQKDPTYLSSFLKNSIITRYASKIPSLLRLVYDGLMQRPPKEILSPSHANSSEEDTPLKSRKAPSVSSKSESVEETQSSRTLVRRHSVMDFTTKRREIVVPVKSKLSKYSKDRRTTRSDVKRSTKKSSAIQKPVTPVKKVRRNLFLGNREGELVRTSPRRQHKKDTTGSENKLTRRHSIATFSRLKKVVDTPVCKQVSRRMLQRQEIARRRAKTVTDVTVVGESPVKDQDEIVRPFPRKSPRRRAGGFYSSNTRKSVIIASSKTVNTARDATDLKDKDPTNKMAENKENRKLLRISSMVETRTTDVEPSPRQRFKRSLSLKEPWSNLKNLSSVGDGNIDEPLDEVFTGTKETYPTSISPKSKVDPIRSPNGLTKTSADPTTLSCLLPSIVLDKSPLVQSARALAQRSKSSPSLSTTSPLTSYPSPSQSSCALITHKSFPSTSPVLFKSSRLTPSRSPATSPEQILDIAIPLTPLKTAGVRTVNSGSKTPQSSPFEKQTPTSDEKHSNATTPEPYTRTRSAHCTLSPGTNRQTIDRNVPADPRASSEQTNDLEVDSESIVRGSPLSDREQSLISSAKLPAEVSKARNIVHVSAAIESVNDEVNERKITNNSPDGENSDLEIYQKTSDHVTTGFFEQSELFASPVATKRKRMSSKRERTSGSVSPLNQILKQRKNNRSTPAGSTFEAISKPDREPSDLRKHHENSSEGKDSFFNQANEVESNPIHVKQPENKRKRLVNLEECSNKLNDPDVILRSSVLTEDLECSFNNARSPSKMRFSDSSKERMERVNFASSCTLQPHFTPVALSAKSLKHLEESPVLVRCQSSDYSAHFSCSLARKWSERKSPLDSSRLSLRKRLRPDS